MVCSADLAVLLLHIATHLHESGFGRFRGFLVSQATAMFQSIDLDIMDLMTMIRRPPFSSNHHHNQVRDADCSLAL